MTSRMEVNVTMRDLEKGGLPKDFSFGVEVLTSHIEKSNIVKDDSAKPLQLSGGSVEFENVHFRTPGSVKKYADSKNVEVRLYKVIYDLIDDMWSAMEGLLDLVKVWMLARMCQLENKIYVVGEPSYRARRYRVKRVREGLENSLKNRIELIENYVRISSMIEIEVELELDVVVTEIVNNVEKIAQQMEKIMEIWNLEKKWRIQDEANDEAERLLSYDPAISEQLSES